MSEFSFQNENQPVCSSVSSCLTLNVSSIFMSSLSSLINDISVCSSVSSCLTLNASSIFTLLFNKRHLYNSVSHGSVRDESQIPKVINNTDLLSYISKCEVLSIHY